MLRPPGSSRFCVCARVFPGTCEGLSFTSPPIEQPQLSLLRIQLDGGGETGPQELLQNCCNCLLALAEGAIIIVVLNKVQALLK
eukprot:2050427-Amphidinium_carterae.1